VGEDCRVNGYTTTVRFEPLSQWPAGRAKTADWQREDAKFKSASQSIRDAAGNYGGYKPGERTSVTKTYDELDRELTAISARDVVVQIDIKGGRRHLRTSDTYPLADAAVNTPAIVLTFTRNKVPYTFACDHFRRWQDNLRAIVLGLEGLRRMERYHIAQAGDQYRGWQALPASTTTALSTDAAANVLANRSSAAPGAIVKDREVARQAYREAAAKVHPDRGGLTIDFQLVQEAKRVLEAHFGGAL
jgi:hypothetical protein